MYTYNLGNGSSIKFNFIEVSDNTELIEASLRVIKNYDQARMWPENHKTTFYVYNNLEKLRGYAWRKIKNKQIFGELMSDNLPTCVVRPDKSYIKMCMSPVDINRKKIAGHEIAHIPGRFVEKGGTIYNLLISILPLQENSCLNRIPLEILGQSAKKLINQVGNVIEDYSANSLYPGPKDDITFNVEELCDDIGGFEKIRGELLKQRGSSKKELYIPFIETNMASDITKNSFDDEKIKKVFKLINERGILGEDQVLKAGFYSMELLSEVQKIKERTRKNYLDVMLGVMGVVNKYESFIRCEHGDTELLIIPLSVLWKDLNGKVDTQILAKNDEEIAKLGRDILSRSNRRFLNKLDCENSVIMIS
jgi:hypothetical protein